MDTGVRSVVAAECSQFYVCAGEDGKALIFGDSPLGLMCEADIGQVMLT